MRFVILLALVLILAIGCDKENEDSSTTGPETTLDGKHIMVVTWDGESGQMVENERIFQLENGASESDFQSLMQQVETFIKAPVEEFQWMTGRVGYFGDSRIIKAMWNNETVEFVESEIVCKLEYEYVHVNLDTLLQRIDASLFRHENYVCVMKLHHISNPIPVIESLEDHPFFEWLDPNIIIGPS